MGRSIAIIDDEPLNLHEIKALANEENQITVLVRLTLSSILKSGCEDIGELLEQKITDEYPGIENYSYGIYGCETDAVLFDVTGSVSSILKEATLREQNQD